MQIDVELIERAHKTVEQMLRDGVTTAKSSEEFRLNMGYCQIVATRMLAVLIYNSAVQSGRPQNEVIDKAIQGIRAEMDEILEAAKAQELQQVQVDFNKQSEDYDEIDAQNSAELSEIKRSYDA